MDMELVDEVNNTIATGIGFVVRHNNQEEERRKRKMTWTSGDEEEVSVVSEEEMDTAECLMLLARGTVSVSATKTIRKVHQCSICGSEFSSGQALGGHMRRHRTTVPSRSDTASPLQANSIRSSRSLLSLDLNLPPPKEDHQTTLVFSSPAIQLGCRN